MGHGIAYVAALAGCRVTLTDARANALPEAMGKIESLLAGGLKRGKLTEADRAPVHARLRAEPALARAVDGADVVIEAVIEDLNVKQRLFSEVERVAPPAALLASNTSSLSIGQIAGALKEPGRLVGMHFFNPVHLMKLFEVVTPARLQPPDGAAQPHGPRGARRTPRDRRVSARHAQGAALRATHGPARDGEEGRAGEEDREGFYSWGE